MPNGPRPHSGKIQSSIEAHTLALAREPRVLEARRLGEQALLAAIPDADPASVERFPEIAEEITLNALVGVADGYTGEDLPRLIMRTPRRGAGPSRHDLRNLRAHFGLAYPGESDAAGSGHRPGRTVSDPVLAERAGSR